MIPLHIQYPACLKGSVSRLVFANARSRLSRRAIPAIVAAIFCSASLLNKGEDIVTSLGGTMTSFRRLKSKIGVRSICSSNDLEPSPDLAKDGRHVMTRTMFCGLNPCQSCSKNTRTRKHSHLEKHPKPSTGNHEATETCKSRHPRGHTSWLNIELGLEIKPCNGK